MAANHGDSAAIFLNEITGELGEKLSGRTEVRVEGTIEEADFHDVWISRIGLSFDG